MFSSFYILLLCLCCTYQIPLHEHSSSARIAFDTCSTIMFDGIICSIFCLRIRTAVKMEGFHRVNLRANLGFITSRKLLPFSHPYLARKNVHLTRTFANPCLTYIQIISMKYEKYEVYFYCYRKFDFHFQLKGYIICTMLYTLISSLLYRYFINTFPMSSSEIGIDVSNVEHMDANRQKHILLMNV